MEFPVRRLSRGSSKGSLSSNNSDDGGGSRHSRSSATSNKKKKSKELEPAVLVYHESARSIVFRDHLRRAVSRQQSSETKNPSTADGALASSSSPRKAVDHAPSELEALTTIATDFMDPLNTVLPSEAGIAQTQIGGYQPKLIPLEQLELSATDEFQALLLQQQQVSESSSSTLQQPLRDWTAAEQEVVQLLQNQQCTVKTIKNEDWTPFLERFQHTKPSKSRGSKAHDDIDRDDRYPFNSFVTSTSLLPPGGLKMRCFGAPHQYTVGVVFGLPHVYDQGETEDQVATRTDTWSWPSGYSAKTEFNIDGRGQLINGRKEALTPLSILRQYNADYLTKKEYMIALRKVAALNQVPYNEIFLRVGGPGRLVQGTDVQTGLAVARSLDRGVGLPVALFVRTATYGHLMTLMRTKSRLVHTLGEAFRDIPLLLVTPTQGVRVLTEALQRDLWKIAARNLNPFQNPALARKTVMEKTDEKSFSQKVDELLDLDESIRELLTPQELARLAGGFGATDDSLATVLKDVMLQDRESAREQERLGGESSGTTKLQQVVNEGLASAVRAGDYHTSRQLLMLYSLVASRADQLEELERERNGHLDHDDDDLSDGDDLANEHKTEQVKTTLGRDVERMQQDLELISKATNGELAATALPPPPPPPPLDTDRLRSATNSDGLLAVLGAAQVLKAMQDGGAKRRVEEVITSVNEWVDYGEQSMAFRISSWMDQRAAQGDLQIATEGSSNFMAFVSNRAIANRKTFADRLREAVDVTDFQGVRFLHAIDEILNKMNSPCLRLELLQYVLGLDNRYSVAHVARSVELAATCLSFSAGTTIVT